MQYTIFELERIEKILTAKLEEAKDAYSAREVEVKATFSENWKGSPSKQGTLEFNKDLAEDWDTAKQEDMQLMFLWGEVDLFQRGINSLYSYWNSSVEIFIDKMRTRTDHEYPEAKRHPGEQ